jgi:hypothetical protein
MFTTSKISSAGSFDFSKEASVLLLENLGSGLLAMHNLPVLHFLFFF